eukprot:2852418-Amphidinium_carterae.1
MALRIEHREFVRSRLTSCAPISCAVRIHHILADIDHSLYVSYHAKHLRRAATRSELSNSRSLSERCPFYGPTN